GTCGFSGDGGAATAASISSGFEGVSVDSAGNIYIADTFNMRIRMVNTGGTISTIAGTGAASYSGDGAAATLATLNRPRGIGVDSSGNILVADSNNGRIRKFASPSASAGVTPVTATTENPGVFWGSASAGGLGGGNILRDIASNGGLFVTVGDAGKVATSPTGANGTWTNGGTGIANNLQGITWGNGKFVAVGAGQTIITSTDGINWVAVTGVPVVGSIRTVNWDATANQFVAVASGGKALTSPAGVTWTSRNTGLLTGLAGITKNPAGNYVAVGTGGKIITSSAGIAWTIQANPSGTGTLNNVVWGSSKFVAVGAGGVLLTSPAGVTWTQQTIPAGVTGVFWGLTWTGTQFVATTSLGEVMTSVDGVTWIERNGADAISKIAVTSGPAGAIVAVGALTGAAGTPASAMVSK
ncbi:MAG: hypothetical protein R8M38_00045, partial [Mariprofundaceae bacterium]